LVRYRLERGDQWRLPHGHLTLAGAAAGDLPAGEAVERFVKALKLQTLPIYLDPSGYLAFSDNANSRNAPFALYGMPITYLIASSGWVVGYMPGSADWSSPAANDLIEYLHNT
jgi:hypothetical protein